MLKLNIKNIINVSFVIIGTIIGAGFASGQEILSFFNIYGEKRNNRNCNIYLFNVIYNI